MSEPEASRFVCDDPDFWDDVDGACNVCGGTGIDEDSCECETVEDTCCCLMRMPRECYACDGVG